MIYPYKKFQSNLDINLAYNYWSVGLSSSGFLPYIHVKRKFGPGTFHTKSALLKGLGHEKNTVFFKVCRIKSLLSVPDPYQF